MDEFGANYVTITDEDGVSYEMEILSRFFCGEQEYVALTPADAEDEAADVDETGSAADDSGCDIEGVVDGIDDFEDDDDSDEDD